MGNKTSRLGATQEIRQLGQAYKKREELQQELDRRNPKLRRRARHLQLHQILQARTQEARFTEGGPRSDTPDAYHRYRRLTGQAKSNAENNMPIENKNPRLRRLGRRDPLPPGTNPTPLQSPKNSADQELYLQWGEAGRKSGQNAGSQESLTS